MTDEAVPGEWRLWLQPSHSHALLVGWLFQFALGIAYWLLPRKRSPERPLGYRISTAVAAVAALNLGLVLRVVAEPAERSGHGGSWTEPVFAVSALLQFGAALIFVTQLWPRIAPREARTTAVRGSQSGATGNTVRSTVGD